MKTLNIMKVDVTAHKLVIKVTDSGVGIPKEKRDQLFKRFMQSNFSGSLSLIHIYRWKKPIGVRRVIIRVRVRMP